MDGHASPHAACRALYAKEVSAVAWLMRDVSVLSRSESFHAVALLSFLVLSVDLLLLLTSSLPLCLLPFPLLSSLLPLFLFSIVRIVTDGAHDSVVRIVNDQLEGSMAGVTKGHVEVETMQKMGQTRSRPASKALLVVNELMLNEYEYDRCHLAADSHVLQLRSYYAHQSSLSHHPRASPVSAHGSD